MARIFLLNPPTAEPIRTPLLAFGYLAGALQRAGHTVALYDASGVAARSDDAHLLEVIRIFSPQVVGVHVKTLYARDAWQLVSRLRPQLIDVKWLAGGPHPTVAQGEALLHGCDAEIHGEAESAICDYADFIDNRRPLSDVAGLWAMVDGKILRNRPREVLLELDELASPVAALSLFDPAWYGTQSPIPYGGLLSSRGCPAACTFCCNNVTGRRFRYRSAPELCNEIQHLQQDWGLRALTFFDDSFAVGRRRVEEIADAMQKIDPVSWACTAHPSHLDPQVLGDLRRAGCGGIDIGMESGDPQRLIRIGKGVTVERVLQVIAWCNDMGMTLVLNLMFGWPGETAQELENTVQFAHTAAQAGALLNARGVLVPYPGTEIYDHNVAQYGFDQWWLRDPPLDYLPFPSAWDEAEVMRAYADDPALARNYFRHSAAHLLRIEAALQLKAQLTFQTLRERTPATTVPAAGAR